jgi:hypothetical protein
VSSALAGTAFSLGSFQRWNIPKRPSAYLTITVREGVCSTEMFK